ISSIVAQNIPESRKSEGINYYSMSTTLATAFGPFLGIFMTQHTTFPVLFLVCLILMGLSLMISFSVKVISDDQSQAIHT
ncbi:MFS transporter, partial [Enterobacter mori]